MNAIRFSELMDQIQPGGEEGPWQTCTRLLHRLRELAGCREVGDDRVREAFPVSQAGISRMSEYLRMLELRLLHWVAFFTQGRPLSELQGKKMENVQETFPGTEEDIRTEMRTLIKLRRLKMEHLHAENKYWANTCPQTARLLAFNHALLEPLESKELENWAEDSADEGPSGGQGDAGTGPKRKAETPPEEGKGAEPRKKGGGGTASGSKDREGRKAPAPSAAGPSSSSAAVGGAKSAAAGGAKEAGPSSAKKKAKKKARRMRSTDSRMCHQCNRCDKPVIFRCTACNRYRYCAGCIKNRYPNLTPEEVVEKCPRCRDECNCGHCRDSKNVPRLPPARRASRINQAPAGIAA